MSKQASLSPKPLFKRISQFITHSVDKVVTTGQKIAKPATNAVGKVTKPVTKELSNVTRKVVSGGKKKGSKKK
jgi:hypothetical protein